MLARFIDHTDLRPEATAADIHRLCVEAKKVNCKAVCVAGGWVQHAVNCLDGEGPKLASVVGFPHGNSSLAARVHEAKLAAITGAEELDLVIALGQLKSGRFDAVEEDIREVVEAARESGEVLVKVILETAALTDDEKKRGCELVEKAGADYVKTSTGFGPGGATVEDVRLLRECVGDRLGVKASGGIRDRVSALAMIEAGASRLGCSSTLAILDSGHG
ncbi:deoxyribose-phosphate aldolase [Acidobacteria bacterium Mor1]|nr:deoxyribose-phosphate aldolase [Acidobacteria bacterium Mor1]